MYGVQVLAATPISNATDHESAGLCCYYFQVVRYKKFYENSSLELLNVQICQKLSIRDKVRAKAKLQVKIACSSDFFPN